LHIIHVAKNVDEIINNLDARKRAHDASKLKEPEKSIYDEYTPKLRDMTYGSDEYKQCLADMGVALKHHYGNNTHHPEYYQMWKCPICNSIFSDKEAIIDFEPDTRLCPKCSAHGAIFESALEPASGIYGMSLLDIIEMLADWKAATARHADGDIKESLRINRERFGISDQLFEILKNTVQELEW
jgi:rubredoxin